MRHCGEARAPRDAAVGTRKRVPVGSDLFVGACAWIARPGNLEVLQWARENGCAWDRHTCACAAEGGHLEVLQWAHANGCPSDEQTCERAARGGHLEVIQWARANGFPFDMVRCEEAIESGIQDRNMFSSSPSSQARNSSLAAELISRLREM